MKEIRSLPVNSQLEFLNFLEQDSTSKKLITAEANRARFYINNYSTYLKIGYNPILPEAIQSLVEYETQKALSLVDAEVTKYIQQNYEKYQEVSRLYEVEMKKLTDKGVWKIAIDVMGNLPTINRFFVPTAWGTDGSEWGKGTTAFDEDIKMKSHFKDGVIFARMDVYEDPIQKRKHLVHELVAHASTVDSRADTPLDENSEKCLYSPDKEWLMEEITAQIVYRMGYYSTIDDPPRYPITKEAQDTTRKAFYVDGTSSSSLKYPGNIKKALEEASAALR